MTRRFSPVALMTVLALLMVVPPARAQTVNLGIKPVNQEGSFFILTLAPGQTANLAVELGNFGTEAIAAATFPADAYSIINGGFAVRLRGEPKTGPTLWTDYTEDVLQLAPRQAVTRTFTVTVPPQTPPGEYNTGLVIQNDKPVGGSGSGVVVNQVNRQAIAIAITVPGPKMPKLEFGAAKHKLVVDRSVVTVELKNSGNVLLKPAGELEIFDASNKTVFTGPVAMDSFYAFNETLIEVAPPERLEPGDYTATVQLSDKERGAEATSGPLPFTVEAGPAPGVKPETAVTKIQDAASNAPPWQLIGGGGLLALVLLLGVLLGRRGRKTESPTTDSPLDFPPGYLPDPEARPEPPKDSRWGD